MTTETTPRGEIYDLGYQRYTGARRGRPYAWWSLYALSVRNAFGLGRGALPKVLAFSLVVLAFIPAIIQLILAAVVPIDEFEFVRPHEYYGFIQIIIVLFVAAVGSDLVGNDQRTHTLSLYFSRPIERYDYVTAKTAALATGLLSITVLPQAVMFAGNWLGSADAGTWIGDNAGDAPRILASGLIICGFLAAVGIAIAAIAERRSFAIISVLAAFLVTLAVVSIVVATVDAEAGRYAVFASPIHVMRGLTLWIFEATPALTAFSQDGDADEQISYANVHGSAYLLAMVAYAAVAAAVTIRRYRRAA